MRLDEAGHLRLGAEQVTELRALQSMLYCPVNGDPERTDGAVALADASTLEAFVLVAEAFGIEAVPQGGEHGADVDLLGWLGELIAPLAAADTLHQAAPTEEPHQLVHMGMAQAFPLGDLRGRHGTLLPPRHLQQATKPVLFL